MEFLVAVDLSELTEIVIEEAKKIAAEEYASPKRKKVALISDNLAHVLVIKFFIIWNKPKTPIKIFKSEEKAFQWLKSD